MTPKIKQSYTLKKIYLESYAWSQEGWPCWAVFVLWAVMEGVRRRVKVPAQSWTTLGSTMVALLAARLPATGITWSPQCLTCSECGLSCHDHRLTPHRVRELPQIRGGELRGNWAVFLLLEQCKSNCIDSVPTTGFQKVGARRQCWVTCVCS